MIGEANHLDFGQGRIARWHAAWMAAWITNKAIKAKYKVEVNCTPPEKDDE